MSRGSNPAFKAFLDFKKHVASTMNISNGPIAGAIAGVYSRKAEKPGMDAMTKFKEAKKLFDSASAADHKTVMAKAEKDMKAKKAAKKAAKN